MSVQEEQQVSELAEKDKLAVDRLTALFDDGAFTEIDGYAKSASGDVEAAAGFGTVNGCPVYAFAQNVNVNGGAISVAQCAKLKKIYDLATKTGCPVIGIYDSNGVKLDEGFEALSAYDERRLHADFHYCRQLFGCQCPDGQYGRCGDRRKGRRFLCNHPQ